MNYRKKGLFGLDQRGVIDPLTLTLISSGIGLLGNLIKPKKKRTQPTTITQEPMYSPNQKEALDALYKYGTGEQEAYQGELGSYAMSDEERDYKTSLLDLAKYYGEPSEEYGMAGKEIKNVLQGDKYNPMSESGEYRTFGNIVNRDTSENMSAIKRNMASMGGLSSTATARAMGDVSTKAGEMKANKLAQLFSQFTQNKLSMIPQAMQLGQLQETRKGKGAVAMGEVAKLGAMERMLNDAKVKEKYAEWQRGYNAKRRALEMVAGSNVPYGAKSVTLPGQNYEESNPWATSLNALSSFGMTYAGNLASQQNWDDMMSKYFPAKSSPINQSTGSNWDAYDIDMLSNPYYMNARNS